jgi:hypothetical protein
VHRVRVPCQVDVDPVLDRPDLRRLRHRTVLEVDEAVKTLGALPPQDELLEDTIQIVDQSLNTFVH